MARYEKYKLHVRVFLSSMRYTVCPDWKAVACVRLRDVRVGGQTLPQICALSIKDASEFFDALDLPEEQSAISDRVLFSPSPAALSCRCCLIT
jgi:excinuclease UvrABC ATPase subunit